MHPSVGRHDGKRRSFSRCSLVGRQAGQHLTPSNPSRTQGWQLVMHMKSPRFTWTRWTTLFLTFCRTDCTMLTGSLAPQLPVWGSAVVSSSKVLFNQLLASSKGLTFPSAKCLREWEGEQRTYATSWKVFSTVQWCLRNTQEHAQRNADRFLPSHPSGVHRESCVCGFLLLVSRMRRGDGSWGITFLWGFLLWAEEERTAHINRVSRFKYRSMGDEICIDFLCFLSCGSVFHSDVFIRFFCHFPEGNNISNTPWCSVICGWGYYYRFNIPLDCELRNLLGWLEVVCVAAWAPPLTGRLTVSAAKTHSSLSFCGACRAERSQSVCAPCKLQLEECLSAELVPTPELIQGYVKKVGQLSKWQA